MVENLPRVETWSASDGYPIHVATWPVGSEPMARVVILHGVQSHGGWYHHLGRTLAHAGIEAHFPDRRGSGANREDRGHTPSPGRLLADVAEYLVQLRAREPKAPIGLAGISWGAKLAVVTAGQRPDLVDALALICPGLHPRVGVARAERWAIALAYFFQPRKTFPIPLSDPALFTDNFEGQAFIANDPLGLHAATARLLASSALIDRAVARVPSRVRQPALLMLAGQDRIIDNDKTRDYFGRLGSARHDVITYPEGHHTLEFDTDPSRYAIDLANWLAQVIGPKERT